MAINAVKNLGNSLALNTNQSAVEKTSDTFSRMLDNLKHGRAADYDEEVVNAEGTTTVTQVMSDGSVLVTVTDANGRVVSQNKTRAPYPDPNAHVIDTTIEIKEDAANTGAALLNLLNFSNFKA